MPVGGRYSESTGRFPVKSARATLNGATSVELVPAPPEGVSHRLLKVFGFNSAGGARVLRVYCKEGAVETPSWFSRSAANNTMFTAYLGVENPDIGLVVSDTDESIVISVTGTGTDVIVASYEVLESK